MTDDDSLNRRIYLELVTVVTGWSEAQPETERIAPEKVREVAQDGANQVCAWLDPDNPPLTADQLARMKPRTREDHLETMMQQAEPLARQVDMEAMAKLPKVRATMPMPPSVAQTAVDMSDSERKARALMDADYTVFHDDVVKGLLADIDRLRELVRIWKV